MLASSLIVKRNREPVAVRWRVFHFVLIIDFSDRDPNRKVQMLAAIVMHTRVLAGQVAIHAGRHKRNRSKKFEPFVLKLIIKMISNYLIT